MTVKKWTYIKPKNLNTTQPEWLISEHTRNIVAAFAEYSEYTESEAVDAFLKNLLTDENFIEWAKNKRNNKRLLKQLGIECEEES
ncbi:hypothetical protein FZC76_05165 [Sutcliffiella horikoshii]|uniref:Uncharacterized protein n=1 Tax=Sutcliffiella horikoshii TaxID=79883 RepID=A0A5D4T1S3_9BACI|nr:hypothetical protein [Sutcliffiella horikoshii]TYS69627.1 hypothetical protein FZC76_05165 [Sutcliffiella horikoshii]